MASRIRGTVAERLLHRSTRDEQSGCLVFDGAKNERGYCFIGDEEGRARKAHRSSYEAFVGPITAGTEVDHICYNRACIEPTHLRLVTRKQNIENRAGLSRANKSGVHGVHWQAGRGRWRARVTHNGRIVFDQQFTSLEDAAVAVKAARLQHFTHNEMDKANG